MVFPLALFYFGNFYSKGVLMDVVSICTILGFSLLISQFFTTRINVGLVQNLKMKKVLSIHKFIGYFFITLLLFHPLFIVIPKFFDNTITPYDAFIRMITTFSSRGVILGIIAYISMVLLILTSLFRDYLGLKYKTWRMLHGILTLVFVALATFHAISLGKHMNTSFEVYYITIAAVGVLFLILQWSKK